MDTPKVKCDCGEEKCPGNKCSIKLFMNKFGKYKQPQENIVEFLKRMNLVSTHKLFPIWDHHYNATKNKMHKFVTSSKKFVDGVNYCRISAKTHPRVWQNVKKYLDCPDTSWSVVYVDQELANVLKQKMLAGRWGNIAGAHERNALELLFQMGTEKESETVPFKNFLLAAHKFYIDFPPWKKIQSNVDTMVVGEHRKVNKSFIDKWIRDILASLMERMHIEVKDNNNMNSNNNNNNNNNNMPVDGGNKFNDNMLVSRQLAESFFNAFAGLAYTILPTTIPIIDLSVFQKPEYPSIQKKCDDLMYHWASSSIHSVSGDKAEEMLLSDTKGNGTYLIRISHHYLWALATVGINKIINEEKFSKHVGPIIICYKNNECFYEQLITFQIMHLTTISNQLSAIPELRHCYVCNQLCFQPKVCDTGFTTQLPSSTPNHSTFSPYNNYKNNNNMSFNNNVNNNNNMNNMNIVNNTNINNNNNNNSLSMSGSNDNMNLNSDFNDYELLTSSFVSVNMNDGHEAKRMKRGRGDNIKVESPFSTSAFNTPIYCIDQNDPTVLSVLQIKLHKTPDLRLQESIIKISYHDNKTYTVECEKINYVSKCLVPFLGKPSPVENKILVINDPKISTTHFLKYIPKMNVWCCGVIEADTSYEVSPGKQIFTDPPMGDTVLFCVSKNDFTPESHQEKEVSNNPFNNNFLMDTTPLNFDNDNGGEFDFSSFLNSPTSVNTSWMINSSKKSPLSSPRSPRSPLSTSGILNLNGPSINPLFSFN